MIRLLLILTFAFILSVSGYSQVKLSLFYAGDKKDTIGAAVEILKKQLSRASAFIYTQKPEKLFDGTGILLSSQPANWPKYTSALKRLGVEGVLVKGTGRGVLIIGNSKMAVEHGIFLYLESLGFRFYFPHPDWHIIPSLPSLFRKNDYCAEPSFAHRRIWCGYGPGGTKAQSDYDFWFKANLQGGALNAYFGHAWDDIVYRNIEKFRQHPEWFYPKPEKGVIPGDPKFNVVDKELEKFLIEDFLTRIEKSKKENTPLYKMLSFGPSDGMGNCSSPECQKIGSITDRVYYLTNKIAAAVRKNHPDSWIGTMAYSEYSAPPTIRLEPNIFVSIATAFNYSKYSTEQLIEAWSKKAKKVGVYDYMALYPWDFDVPGRQLGSVPSILSDRIKRYYSLGARAYEAETTTGWAGKGLGQYIAAKLLWNIKSDTKKIESEFYKNCFGSSANKVKLLYDLFAKNTNDTPAETDLGEWIDQLFDIYESETDMKVKQRLYHIKIYLYYQVLLRKYKGVKDEQSLVQLLNYSYRMLDYAAFAGYPALFELGNTTAYPKMKFNDEDAKWKTSKKAYNEEELTALLKAERGKLKIITGLKKFGSAVSFEKIKYLGAGKNISGYDSSIGLWMNHDFIIQIEKKGKDNYIVLSGGWVTGGGSEKPIAISVFPYSVTNRYDGSPLLSYDYKKSKEFEKISLSALDKGTYCLRVIDPAKIFNISFSPAVNHSILVSEGRKVHSNFVGSMFLYVPNGVSNFSLWKSIEVRLVSPTGRVVDYLNKKEEEIEVKVKPDEIGLWKINYFSGAISIRGVPPVIGIVPDKMLLPSDK